MENRYYHIMSNISAVIILLAFSFGCKNSSGGGTSAPEVISVNPTKGPAGTEVVVAGNGYNATASENSVTFNQVEAEVISATEEQLIAVVPEGATTGPIAVSINGKTATGPNFTVEAILKNKIVFRSRRDDSWDLFAINPDGSNMIQITENDESEAYHAISPDGKYIAYRTRMGDERNIWVINANGSNPVQLTEGAGKNSHPSWSPDGNQIVFQSNRDGDYDLYVMNANGSEQTKITDDPNKELYPDWSPDGEKILFTRDSNGRRDLYTVDPEGTSVKQLTNTKDEENTPVWSPDGTQIAFVRNTEEQIIIIDENGDNRRPVTIATGRNGAPSWSPDGSQLAFFSLRDGDPDIYVINTGDTSSAINITQNSQSYDYSPVWSPVK